MHPDATSTGSAGPIVERFTKLAFRKKAGASRERRRNNIGKDMQEGHDRLASMLLYESSHGFDKEKYHRQKSRCRSNAHALLSNISDKLVLRPSKHIREIHDHQAKRLPFRLHFSSRIFAFSAS